MAFCTGCGGEVVGAAKFCGHCGQQLAVQSEVFLDYGSCDVPPNEPEKSLSQVRPWVRYFARSIDIVLFSFIFGLGTGAVELIYPGAMADVPDSVWGLIILCAWVFVEPLCLCTMSTTPGKWLLRTTILTDDGEKLSFGQALGRSASVWWCGMAMGVPLFNIATAIYGYRRLTTRGKTSWDENGGFFVTHGHIGLLRAAVSAIFLIASLLIILATSVTSRNSSMRDYVQGLQQRRDATPTPTPTPTPTTSTSTSTLTATEADGDWDKTFETFEVKHHDLKLGGNAAIMQAKVNTYATSRLPPSMILDNAYAAAKNATGWTTPSSTPEDEASHWSDDVQELITEHPALRYGNNLSILQEKLYQVAKPGMTNYEELQQAYNATTADDRWSQTP
jgi:uncharacterized RDD family membrane protein YckC